MERKQGVEKTYLFLFNYKLTNIPLNQENKGMETKFI